jgi:hypothetical protein
MASEAERCGTVGRERIFLRFCLNCLCRLHLRPFRGVRFPQGN